MDFNGVCHNAAGVTGLGSAEAKRAAALAIALELIKSKSLGSSEFHLHPHMQKLGEYADLIQEALKVK